MLYKVVLTVKSVNKILKCDLLNEIFFIIVILLNESYEQYFLVVLFVILYKAVLTFEFVNKILKCDHSNVGY